MIKKQRYNNNFALYCKTYSGDLDSFDRFIDSYIKYNKDNICLYISVPSNESGLYNKYKDLNNVVFVHDEDYAENYFTDTEYWGLSIGYINQEICKLAFWETGRTENYLCVDSDAVFIKDFYKSDFMFNDHIPYSVLVMDKDLNIQRDYIEFGKWRTEHIKNIFNYIGLDDPRMLTSHGMTILNSTVLNDFSKNLMRKKSITYRQLIEKAPYEFTWYNAWLQKSKIIPIYNVEPFFKTFHTENEYIAYKQQGISIQDIALKYVGIVFNSNWAKDRGVVYNGKDL